MLTFRQKIKSFFKRSDITPGFWDDLEDLLLTSDVGLATTQKIIDSVRDLKKIDDVKARLREVMREMLSSHPIKLGKKPHVMMVVGVNGAGKTTTIAKLANRFKNDGKKAILVAADTFRAAAIDQLKVWGERLEIPVVAQKPDSDPAAVAFDGIKSAIAKDIDVVILDTAGRLHTNRNLMEELSKVKRVSNKAMDGAPHDIILVLDATVGQNGLQQAKVFNDALGITGIVVAKMDGTAKGGIIIAIADELGLPVSFMGVGEKLKDMEEFSPSRFISDILE